MERLNISPEILKGLSQNDLKMMGVSDDAFLTDEQKAINKQRLESDAQLIAEGAAFDSKGRLWPTPEQIDEILIKK